MIRTLSIPLGHFFGVEVRMHLCCLLLLLMCLTQTAALKDPNLGWGHGTALWGFVMGAVLLRETARLIMSAARGVRVRQLILLPTGGLAVAGPGEERFEPRKEISIALAGILTNLLAGGVAALAIYLFGRGQIDLLGTPYLHAAHLLRSLVWINVCMGLLNIMPVYPLDGGRILRVMLAQGRPIYQATRSVVGLSQA